jgi:hypothetical protein
VPRRAAPLLHAAMSATGAAVYVSIIQVLVPLYLVILLGYAAGAQRTKSAPRPGPRNAAAACVGTQGSSRPLARAHAVRYGVCDALLPAPCPAGAWRRRKASARPCVAFRRKSADGDARATLRAAPARRQASSRWRMTSCWTG